MQRCRLNEVLKQLRVEDIQVFVIGLVTDLDREAGLIKQSPKDKAEKLLTSAEKLKAIAPRGYYVEAKDVKKQATEPKSP